MKARYLFILLTGIVLIACQNNQNSIVGQWEYAGITFADTTHKTDDPGIAATAFLNIMAKGEIFEFNEDGTYETRKDTIVEKGHYILVADSITIIKKDGTKEMNALKFKSSEEADLISNTMIMHLKRKN